MSLHHDPELDDVLQDQELLHLATLLASARRAEPPLDEAFRSGLRRQLVQRAWEMAEGRPSRPSLWRSAFGPPLLAWAGAAAGIVLIASVVLYMGGQGPGGFTQQVSKVNSPMDGAVAVRLGQPILVSFNQPMNRASTEKAVQITPTTSVTFSWLGDNKLAIQPTSGTLAPNTQYKVTIGSGALTKSNQKLASAPTTITFVTQPPATPSPSPAPTAPPTPGSLLSGEHQVVALVGAGTPALQWSADSSTAYFVAPGGKLEAVDIKSGAVSVVAADSASSPAIAPAGDRLAYVRGGKIEVLTFATGTTAELAVTPAATVVGWATDKLVWAAVDGLYTQSANGPVQVAPLPAGGSVSVVSIAPGGAAAVIQQDQKLVLFEPPTGNTNQLGQAGAQFLGWSPDGSKLLYSSPDGTVVADTKNTTLATLPAGEPSWSGQDAILLGSDVDLLQVRPDGSSRVKLASGTYRAPSWAPNGTSFAYIRGGALWTATAPALPPQPSSLDLAAVVVNSFMLARLQNQPGVATTFLDDNGKQAYASGGLNLSLSNDPRFSRYYILAQELVARKPAEAVFVVRLVLAQGKLDVSEIEETLTVVRDPTTRLMVIDQATGGARRDLGKGPEVVGVDVTPRAIELTFDSDLAAGSVPGAVLVLDDKGKQLDGTVTYGNRTVTITGLDLAQGAQYKLVVLPTLRDVVGNNLASEYDLVLFGPVRQNQAANPPAAGTVP